MQVDIYLNHSDVQKSQSNREPFPRLKVQCFHLNDIWSLALADMQKLPRYNFGDIFISVVYDTLSRFVWALPLKKKTAAECKIALRKVIDALYS